MSRMKTVKQEHPDGCGIACVAMLAGKSYDNVRAEMFSFRTRENKIKDWLREFGVKTGARFVPLNGRDYRSLPFDAVLGVNYREEPNWMLWHWVVWDAAERKVRDPENSKTKRRYKADRYLRIYPKASSTRASRG